MEIGNGTWRLEIRIGNWNLILDLEIEIENWKLKSKIKIGYWRRLELEYHCNLFKTLKPNNKKTNKRLSATDS